MYKGPMLYFYVLFVTFSGPLQYGGLPTSNKPDSFEPAGTSNTPNKPNQFPTSLLEVHLTD